MKHKSFSQILYTVVIIISLMVRSATAFAVPGVPDIISYQGRLTNNNGILLGGTGTTYYFKFSIWDTSSVGGGTRLWPSTAPGSIPLTVTDGVFDVNIGDTASGYPDALTYDFQSNDTVYLQVEVSPNGSSYETLGPRSRITSSSMSINAKTLSGLPSSYFLDATNLANFDTRAINAPLTGYTSGAGTITASDSILTAIQKLNGNIGTGGIVSSVFGRNGAITAQSGDYTTAQVTESGNLYYTDARARAALSVVGAPLSYNSSTGVFSITQATGSADGYLSSTDWNTFNAKQNAITTGSTAQYLRGDLSLATFPTAVSSFSNDSGYLTTNQSITLSGAVTGTGTTAITTSLANGVVGIANLSATGTPSASTYLRGDNTWATVSGGTVSSVSVATANGFSGSVANATTTPSISITTNINGILKGDGTAISAATAGDFPTLNQNTTGSAATLTTPRTINGTSFDGSANITVTAAAGTLSGSTLNASVTGSSLTSVGTIATGTWQGTPIADAYIASASTWNAKENALTFSTPLSRSSNTISIDNAAADGVTKGVAAFAAADFDATSGVVSIDYTNGQFASTSNNGFLSSTDWNTFNNKGNGTVTSVAGTGTVNGLTLTGTVTTSGSLTLGGTLSGIANSSLANSSLTIGSTNIALGGTSTTLAGLTSVSATTFTGALSGNATTATALATGRTIAITGDIAYTSPSFDGSGNVTAAGTLATVNSNVGSFTNASITVNAKGLITAASSGAAPEVPLTFSAPLSRTGNTISMPVATTSSDGYLSSTDWTTFNGKQEAITLTTTGTSGAATFSGGVLNIPQYAGGGSYTFSTGLTNTSNTITNDLSTGISGGQSVIGGTAASDSLTLSSTTNATKGSILFGTSSYNESVNTLGIGTTAATTNRVTLADTVFAVGGSSAGALLNMTQTWNTTGAPSAILLNITNTASAATSNFANFQIAGTSIIALRRTGTIVLNGTNNVIQNASSVGTTFGNTGMSYSANPSSFAVTLHNFGASSNSTATSGTVNNGAFSAPFVPSSGTATFTGILYSGTINQTGSASGITRGLFINPTITAAADFRAIELASLDRGNGAAGQVIFIGRNTNATNTGAGSINFLNKAGTNGYVWQDAAGNMRINTAAPTNANDTAGTVIGAQTSTRETKQDIAEYTDYSDALSMVLDAPLRTFKYIKEVQGYGIDSPLAKTRIGYIADEVSPAFMVGNTIDQVSVNGILMASIKALNIKITDLSSLAAGEPNSLATLMTKFFQEQAIRINDLTAGVFHITDQVCVDDVCATKEEFKSLLLQAKNNTSGTQSTTTTTSTPVSDLVIPTDTVIPVDQPAQDVLDLAPVDTTTPTVSDAPETPPAETPTTDPAPQP